MTIVKENNITKHIIELCILKNKKLDTLTKGDILNYKYTKHILQKSNIPFKQIINDIKNSLSANIEKGLQKYNNTTFLHTAPHQDDILLGYHPYLIELTKEPENSHSFVYMTSGYKGVTNDYMLKLIKSLINFIQTKEFIKLFKNNYFEPSNIKGHKKDIYKFIQGFEKNNKAIQNKAISMRLFRNIIRIYNDIPFNDYKIENIVKRTSKLINYFISKSSVRKETKKIQKLKGTVREFEAEIALYNLGIEPELIHPLRLALYQSSYLKNYIGEKRDINSILSLIKKINPDVITVALDPKGTGPDTHFKALSALAKSIRLYLKKCHNPNLKIWGYRNIWSEFHLSESNFFIPVSKKSISILNKIFKNCFASQLIPAFPSKDFNDSFSKLSTNIMIKQLKTIEILLGKNSLKNFDIKYLNSVKGLIFLKEMTINDLNKFLKMS